MRPLLSIHFESWLWQKLFPRIPGSRIGKPCGGFHSVCWIACERMKEVKEWCELQYRKSALDSKVSSTNLYVMQFFIKDLSVCETQTLRWSIKYLFPLMACHCVWLAEMIFFTSYAVFLLKGFQGVWGQQGQNTSYSECSEVYKCLVKTKLVLFLNNYQS